MRRREDPTAGIEIVRAPLGQSDYTVAAQKMKKFGGEQRSTPKSEKQIVQEIRRTLPLHYWMLQDGYNNRKPHDAWEITVGNQSVKLFNYAENVTIREEQIQKITVHLALFAMHLVEYDPDLDVITVTDHLSENLTPDGAFKRHAEAQPAANMFALTPRTFEEGIYRPDLEVERLGGVVLHELAHFDMDSVLSPGWPEDRVTTYSEKFGEIEDIPESVVAYLLGVGQLSSPKRELLAQHDHWLSKPEMLYTHLSDFEPPEPPEIVTYYVDEEAVDGSEADQ